MEITITFKDLLILFTAGEWDVETFMLGLPNIAAELCDTMFDTYLGTHIKDEEIEYYASDIFNLSGINTNDKDYSDKDISAEEEIFTPLCNLILIARPNNPHTIEVIKYNSAEDITEIHYALEDIFENETLSEDDNIIFTEESI